MTVKAILQQTKHEYALVESEVSDLTKLHSGRDHRHHDAMRLVVPARCLEDRPFLRLPPKTVKNSGYIGEDVQMLLESSEEDYLCVHQGYLRVDRIRLMLVLSHPANRSSFIATWKIVTCIGSAVYN